MKKISNWAVLGAGLFLSVCALAEVRTAVHSELDGWNVDAYQLLSGELQDHVGHWVFKNEADARAKEIELKAQSPMSNEVMLLPPESREGFLWEIENEWSWEWEQKYAAWVTENVDTHFFQKYNIATDCADTAYAFRWIFSRIHHLPAANTLAGSEVLMTQDSYKKSWENLPTAREWSKDERFIAALKYLLDNTYTYMLFSDSYPIEVSLQSLTPGAHFLDLHSANTGHTQFVFRVNSDRDSFEMPVTTIWSNTPTIVRELYKTDFFQSRQPKQDKGGFLRLRWPIKSRGNWVLKSGERHPFYSLAQYTPEFMGADQEFVIAVFKKIRPTLDVVQIMKSAVQAFKDAIEYRIQLVSDGFQFCKQNDCSPGTQNYDDWSTPSRDARIVEVINHVENISSMTGETFSIYEDLADHYKIQIEGQSIDYFTMASCLSSGECSTDPRDSIKKRWGIAETRP